MHTHTHGQSNRGSQYDKEGKMDNTYQFSADDSKFLQGTVYSLLSYTCGHLGVHQTTGQLLLMALFCFYWRSRLLT